MVNSLLSLNKFKFNFAAVMSETTFKDRVSEMIKNKISPTHTMDDECDQMWTEILIQVFESLC